MSDWSLDLAVAPEAAVARIAANINRRGKRAFGVLKTENEFVGVIRGAEFEFWERQKRAIRARGLAHARRGGTHLEVAFVLPLRTRALLVLLGILYVLAAIGIAGQPPDTAISGGDAAIALLGAVVLAAIFAASARSQRADLRRHLERAFAEVPRI